MQYVAYILHWFVVPYVFVLPSPKLLINYISWILLHI